MKSDHSGNAGGAVCASNLNLIEPNSCIIEDLEILAFENEEQLNYYTIWHEALIDKRRVLNAGTERERQVIRNEIARKNRHLIVSVESDDKKKTPPRSGSKSSKSTKSPLKIKRVLSPTPASPPRKAVAIAPSAATPAAATPIRRTAASVAPLRPSTSNQTFVEQSAASHNRQGSANPPDGLTVITATLPCNQQLLKYKMTKMYNKYRGRQTRRNYVLEKQRNAKIETEVGKSYLNSWLAYTALQALRLPETQHTLNATTNNHTKILTPMAQPVPQTGDKTKSSKKQTQSKASSEINTPQQLDQKPPFHLVYIDPSNIITYSNKINPQQVAEYKRKSHLLPSLATSKKSSAASYDVYEIMDILANSNKTNVTITRNANRPSQDKSNASIYSHSVNANTPGIVSTQLHLQAKSSVDWMKKFYAEEEQRLVQAAEELQQEPTGEELIGRYLDLSLPGYVSQKTEETSLEEEDCFSDEELEKMENDIWRMINRDTRQSAEAN